MTFYIQWFGFFLIFEGSIAAYWGVTSHLKMFVHIPTAG